MNAPAGSPWRLTLEEYLAAEAQSDTRHEYVNGEIYALAGASERHQLIVLNIAAALLGPARARDCRTLLGGVKLQVSETIVYYPDVVVNCDPTDDDPYVKRRAMLIGEVLSPSTASTDRREKAMLYLQMPTLLCYMIVHQDTPCVELHWRPDTASEWRFELVVGRSIPVPGLEFVLPFEQIYAGIDFGAVEPDG